MKERKEKTFSVLDSIHRLNLSFHFFGVFLGINLNWMTITTKQNSWKQKKNCKVKPDRKFKIFKKIFWINFQVLFSWKSYEIQSQGDCLAFFVYILHRWNKQPKRISFCYGFSFVSRFSSSIWSHMKLNLISKHPHTHYRRPPRKLEKTND